MRLGTAAPASQVTFPTSLHNGARVCSPGLVNPPGLAPPLWNLYSRLAAAEAELGEVRTLLRDAVEGLQVFSGEICLIPFHTLPIFSQV